jgi:hypothetical protein
MKRFVGALALWLTAIVLVSVISTCDSPSRAHAAPQDVRDALLRENIDAMRELTDAIEKLEDELRKHR